MALETLQQLLGSLDDQASWQTRRQFQKVTARWPAIVGPAVAAQTRPVGIQRQVLHVATASSAWAQNLMFERSRILEKLNAQLSLHLTDIRFSSAQWHDTSIYGATNTESARVWSNHPSRVEGALPTTPSRSLQTAPTDPKAAFEHWAKTVQGRSRHLPLCPTCQCPTPAGELSRWSVCSLCAAKQWT